MATLLSHLTFWFETPLLASNYPEPIMGIMKRILFIWGAVVQPFISLLNKGLTTEIQKRVVRVYATVKTARSGSSL